MHLPCPQSIQKTPKAVWIQGIYIMHRYTVCPVDEPQWYRCRFSVGYSGHAGRPGLCIHLRIYTSFNPKRNMRGPCGPRKTLTGAATVITSFAYLSCHAIMFLGSVLTPYILQCKYFLHIPFRVKAEGMLYPLNGYLGTLALNSCAATGQEKYTHNSSFWTYVGFVNLLTSETSL